MTNVLRMVTYVIIRTLKPLKEMKYSDFTQQHLGLSYTMIPPDVSHDLFEGVVPEVILGMLKHINNEGILTYYEINELMNQFVFATTDKRNKPSVITLDSNGRNPKLNHTQSQMRCFSRLLPLIIGHSVEETDEHWVLYMCLLDVLDYVCAFKFNAGDIQFLNELVEFFQSNA